MGVEGLRTRAVAAACFISKIDWLAAAYKQGRVIVPSLLPKLYSGKGANCRPCIYSFCDTLEDRSSRLIRLERRTESCLPAHA